MVDELHITLVLTWYRPQSVLATYIFPAKCSFAALTIDVSNSMESCEKYSFLCWPTTNIHPERYNIL
jgi:hypothetical protein